MRLLILLGLISLGVFLWWFADPDHVGYKPLFWLLTFALGFEVLRMLHEWYHYAAVSVPEMPELTRDYSVDMLTIFCAGEPYAMILNTLKAMKAVTYPHETYLCDEANDPYLKQMCAELGVHHVYRGEDKSHAKAGNINYTLRNHAKGEISIVLDPDHEPVPDFIDRVLPYFENPEIGYVQCVQAYGNRQESFIAKGAAEQTYHFYGPMMMSMNAYGTAQAIGANCTFRRAALDSIGGHASGLSEDMHTAMQIHAKGWKSVYVPEMLTRGLVPATFSAYLKQQLKWSRGCFELLFEVYPKLFGKFTWRQRIHYFLIPLYFLSGFITLLDILVPVLSLFLARVPWHVNMIDFFLFVTPLLMMNMLIRQYAQRFLLEEHERGFHVLGGILRAGSWWAFLVGFLYSIVRVKVPYIPTPKDDALEDSWRLNLPNILAIVISLIAIIYGLSLDWNPYTFLMAGFAMTNVFILTVLVLMAQQRTMTNLYHWLNMDTFITGLRSFWWNLRHYILYRLIRNSSLVMAVVILMAISGYAFYDNQQRLAMREKAMSEVEKVNWFYQGIAVPAAPTALTQVLGETQAALGTDFGLLALPQAWETAGPVLLSDSLLEALTHRGVVPMLDWQGPAIADSSRSEWLKALVAGDFDQRLREQALQVRQLTQPVFLRFAPAPSHPDHAYPADTYVAAWRHLVGLFVEEGVANVAWVWSPYQVSDLQDHYPGDNYVHWMGVSLPEEAPANFAQWYEPFHLAWKGRKGREKKPVMLTELNLGAVAGSRSDWAETTMKAIETRFSEVRSLVLAPGDTGEEPVLAEVGPVWQRYFGHTAPFNERPPFLAQGQFKRSVQIQQATPLASFGAIPVADTPQPAFQSPHVTGKPGSFRLLVDGQPSYIKGVAYNPTHDMRDGYLPLTRRQLTEDFSRIKAMGANTIRRYGSSGVYDHNILTIAAEQDLKVLHGLWFDPRIDYYADTAAANAVFGEALTTIESLKSYPAIMAWSVGNETWASLGRHFAQPYLTRVRQAFMHRLEELTQQIKAQDPSRPVIIALDHTDQLAATLQEVRAFVPSVDLIGINTYYGTRIEQLSAQMAQLAPGRPYLVTSFGPRRYWDPAAPEYIPNVMPEENSSFEKARQYTQNWQHHVEAHAGQNLGGFAFCWQDRLEGTATWFGITDYKGRLKPAYYGLKSAWLKEELEPPLAEAYIIDPSRALIPGETIIFQVATPNHQTENIRYEWFLMREKYLDESGDVKRADSGRKAKVEIPDDEYSYRLYLYISDQEGNVVTASKPLRIAREGGTW